MKRKRQPKQNAAPSTPADEIKRMLEKVYVNKGEVSADLLDVLDPEIQGGWPIPLWDLAEWAASFTQETLRQDEALLRACWEVRRLMERSVNLAPPPEVITEGSQAGKKGTPGRPTRVPSPKTLRSVLMSDEDWERVRIYASAHQETDTEYIRRAVRLRMETDVEGSRDYEAKKRLRRHVGASWGAKP